MPSKEVWKRNARNKAWRERNRDNQRRYYKRVRKEARIEALEHYGGKCFCCGETLYEFLAVHHIDGGGNKHRKSLGYGSGDFCRWLKKNGWPEGYRTSCHNCNSALGFYGYCPHQTPCQSS